MNDDDARQYRVDRDMERELHSSEFFRHHPEYLQPVVLTEQQKQAINPTTPGA